MGRKYVLFLTPILISNEYWCDKKILPYTLILPFKFENILYINQISICKLMIESATLADGCLKSPGSDTQLSHLRSLWLIMVYLCETWSVQLQSVLRSEWPGPLQEAQCRRCALQASPYGAYRLIHTLRWHFSPGPGMLSKYRLDCGSACKPEICHN